MWMGFISQVGMQGHIKLGRFLAFGVLGNYRTPDTITITYRRVQIPGRVQASRAVVPPQRTLNPTVSYCNSCGTVVHIGSRFCSSCGTPVGPQQQPVAIVPTPAAFCSTCGEKIGNSQGICTRCTEDELERGEVTPAITEANSELRTKEPESLRLDAVAQQESVGGFASASSGSAKRPQSKNLGLVIFGLILGGIILAAIAIAGIFGKSPPDQSSSSVIVSCSPSYIQVNQTSNCSATVTGDFDASIAWSVDTGSIDRSGNYTAPSSPSIAMVTASSRQDPTKSGRVRITVNAPPPTPATSQSQLQIVRPSIPPPKFQIYRYKPDGISPVSIVVPVNTSDEQLKSLLRFFREKARSHRLKDIGLRNERDGILLVYRDKKCATEEIDITASAGPCGDGYHDDALYQWGIEGDYDKDSGSIRVNGNDIIVFDYKTGG
jgi:hypothetical protein